MSADTFHLALPERDEFVITGTDNWTPWVNPRRRGLTRAEMWCISSGASGGSGASNGAGNTKGGGGGGGSSGIAKLSILLRDLPDVLWLFAPKPAAGVAGGTGVANGANGNDGALAYVSVLANSTANNLFLVSGAAAPVKGSLGSTASGGGGGTAGTIATVAGCPLSFKGTFSAIAGMNGTAGGSSVVGTDQTYGIAGMILGGTGGGGTTTTDRAGGGVTAVANTLLIAFTGGAAGSGDGPSGFQLGRLPVWVGGLGGGGSNSAVGGAGGNGFVPGAGGGGGGGGLTGSGGGRSGDGGPGQVGIICF